MEHLHSPIVGALSLNYYSYGLLYNLWACLTAIVAALGFCKLKPLSHHAADTAPNDFPAEPVNSEKINCSSPPPSISNTTSLYCQGGSPKVKFRIRYEEEEDDDEFEEIEEEEEWKGECGATVVARGVVCGGEWERGMLLRMGDLGWYTCQDRTLLNGSVVRLWETSRR